MVRMLTPGERHCEILQRLLIEGRAGGPLAMDAHLAALAIGHGAVLSMTDREVSLRKSEMWHGKVPPCRSPRLTLEHGATIRA